MSHVDDALSDMTMLDESLEFPAIIDPARIDDVLKFLDDLLDNNNNVAPTMDTLFQMLEEQVKESGVQP